MICSPYRPELVTAPVAQLLTRAEAKLHLRLDEDDTSEDALVDGLIATATAYLDGHAGVMGRCLINQQWRVWFDCWDRCWRLPFPDVSAVVVAWTDENGIATTVSADDYRLLEDHSSAFIRFEDDFASPSGDIDDRKGWSVLMTAGYGAAASDVPPPIRQAALLMIGHWYSVRESVNIGNIVSEVPMGATLLTAPLRRVGI